MESREQPPRDLKDRTKQFALRVIKLANSLPNDRASDVIGRQLIKSGTSVAANYRAACRARSTKEFCSKLGNVEEEADESAFWIEMLIESGMIKKQRLEELHSEAEQLTKIIVASIRTARNRSNRPDDAERK